MCDRKIKILVCYHKQDKLFKNEVLMPIHCGRALALERAKTDKLQQKNCKWLSNNMIGDNTGENISDKNGSYCELTALYWAWKNYENLGDPEYIGLMHYRRLLDFQDKYPSKEFVNCLNIKDWSNKIVSKSIDVNDVILPMPFDFAKEEKTVREQYEYYHNIDDLNTVIEIMAEKYSWTDMEIINNYLDSYQSAMCNIFVMKKELFFEYCSWLFDILNEAEKRINVSDDSYQKRVFGFLSERMFNMFVLQKQKQVGLKIVSKPILNLKQFDFSKFAWKMLLRKVFSIINTSDKMSKIITILGFKIKINKTRETTL